MLKIGRRLFEKQVFKSGLRKVCGRQSLQSFNAYGLLKQSISLEIFKSCLPQNLLSPFLNTLSHIILYIPALLVIFNVFILAPYAFYFNVRLRSGF